LDRKRKFYPELESSRGIAALTVVLYHIAQLSSEWSHSTSWTFFQTLFLTLFNGGSAVLLFFVLSALLMGVNIDTRKSLTAPLLFGLLVDVALNFYPAVIGA
jgi:peptidoglycan/LPS O-acetylase OafA/YrhL